MRLDNEAVETIKKARLHRKVATAIFFESNGGQTQAEATVPEIRLAVAEPGLDIGNVETALEALTDACYYLDGRAQPLSVQPQGESEQAFCRPASDDSERAGRRAHSRTRSRKVFAPAADRTRVYFPEKTHQVPDRPAVTLVVLAPDTSMQDEATTAVRRNDDPRIRLIGADIQERTDLLRSRDRRRHCARERERVLAWEDIEDDDLKARTTPRATSSPRASRRHGAT